jgi:Na+-driven multidrug efflux pump
VNIGFVISLAAFLSSLFFNYVFIYGNFGAPAMDVAGAGLAILLTRMLEFGIVAFYVLRVDKKICYRPADILLRDKKISFDYFRYGLPVICGDFTWGIGNAAKASIIGRLGEAVIAANSIVGSLGMLFMIFISGMATAGSLTVGQAIGNNDFDRAKSYTKTLQCIYPTIGLISATVMFCMRGPALSLFEWQSLTSETMRHCVEFYTILCVTMIGTSYQMSTLQIVRAGGAPHFVFVNDLIFVWLVMIPMALIGLNFFHAPPWFIIFALSSDQILKCGVAIVKANRFRWMRNLTRQEAAA